MWLISIYNLIKPVVHLGIEILMLFNSTLAR